MEFDHIGLRATAKKREENWVEDSRCWVTNPKDHPFHVEWLRYEADSPVPEQVKERPHIAFRVDSIDAAARGLKVLIQPWVVGDFVRVGFFEYEDGTIVELMEYLKGDDAWFPDKP